MKLASFLYNIALIIVYVITVSTCVDAYSRTHRLIYRHLSGLFVIFIVDTTILYVIEFITGSSAAVEHFPLHYPVLRMSITALMMCFYVLLLNDILERRLNAGRFFPVMLYCAAAFILIFIPQNRWVVWGFYEARFFEMFLLYSIFAVVYLRMDDQTRKERIKSFTPFLIASVALMIMCFLEESVMTLQIDPFYTWHNRAFLNERSICEDLYSLIFSGAVMVYARPVHDIAPQTPEYPSVPDSKELQALKTEAFCKAYQLTSREREIFMLLQENMGNQEISDKLFISLGTVKTHIHNIFQKVDVTKRSQLFLALEVFDPQSADPKPSGREETQNRSAAAAGISGSRHSDS